MTQRNAGELALRIITGIVMCITTGVILIHIAAIYYIRRRLYRKSTASQDPEKAQHSQSGVSIFKPLTGLDPNLEKNLTTFFTMKYPRYELLFCTATPDDPACELVRRLMDRYPAVEASLLTCAPKIGVNNKINNLLQAYEKAQYDLILISDSGIFMRDDTLADMVETMEGPGNVGMVHQVPWVLADPSPNFVRVYQIIYFGTWHAKLYMAAAAVGINCTTGMSCMMRKHVLDRAGGLRAFGCYLAEDFFLSKHFYDNNWSVVVSGQPAWQNAPWGTLDSFKERLIRWHQLRVAMTPVTTVLEPFTECFPNALLTSLLWGIMLPDYINWTVFFMCYVLVWFILDYMILLSMLPPGEPLGFSRLEFLVVWFFREVTSLLCQLRSFFKTEVKWRSKRYYLHWGGITEELGPVDQKSSQVITS